MEMDFQNLGHEEGKPGEITVRGGGFVLVHHLHWRVFRQALWLGFSSASGTLSKIRVFPTAFQ